MRHLTIHFKHDVLTREKGYAIYDLNTGKYLPGTWCRSKAKAERLKLQILKGEVA